MQLVTLHDQICRHQIGLSKGYSGKYFQWDRTNDNPIHFFTDWNLWEVEHIQCHRKIAVLLEPKVIYEFPYRQVEEHLDLFDYVLTCDFNLVDSNREKCLWIAPSTSWIPREDMKIYPKTKKICIVASTKNKTANQNLRQMVVSELGHELDVYGIGRPGKMLTKLEILKDYMFSIEIENSYQPWYFTEKILDPMAVGTVPIYYYSDFIELFFNKYGMKQFKNLKELKEIVDYIQYDPGIYDAYNSLLPYIRLNLSTVQSLYHSMDEYIFEHYPFLFYE